MLLGGKLTLASRWRVNFVFKTESRLLVVGVQEERGGRQEAWCFVSASERRGDNSKRWKGSYLTAKAGIWS